MGWGQYFGQEPAVLCFVLTHNVDHTNMPASFKENGLELESLKV